MRGEQKNNGMYYVRYHLKKSDTMREWHSNSNYLQKEKGRLGTSIIVKTVETRETEQRKPKYMISTTVLPLPRS